MILRINAAIVMSMMMFGVITGVMIGAIINMISTTATYIRSSGVSSSVDISTLLSSSINSSRTASHCEPFLHALAAFGCSGWRIRLRAALSCCGAWFLWHTVARAKKRQHFGISLA